MCYDELINGLVQNATVTMISLELTRNTSKQYLTFQQLFSTVLQRINNGLVPKTNYSSSGTDAKYIGHSLVAF